jgi:hypothetical protein
MVSALRVEEGSAAIGPVAGVSTRYLIKRLATMRLEGGTDWRTRLLAVKERSDSSPPHRHTSPPQGRVEVITRVSCHEANHLLYCELAGLASVEMMLTTSRMTLRLPACLGLSLPPALLFCDCRNSGNRNVREKNIADSISRVPSSVGPKMPLDHPSRCSDRSIGRRRGRQPNRILVGSQVQQSARIV